MNLIVEVVVFILIPVIAIIIDSYAAFKSRKSTYNIAKKYNYNFSVIVPIYGNTKYLENVQYLRKYKNKVILCTTGDESDSFYTELKSICQRNGFKIFIDKPVKTNQIQSKNSTERSTSGTIRDRLIRNVLIENVKTKYVIPLDADTVTDRPLSLFVGELVHKKFDIASIRLVLTNRAESLLTQLQYHEYQTAMQLRYIYPWMISGACNISRTEVLREIMNKHSLFFQGNDVEVGILATALKYKIGHIPLAVSTAVPASLKAWFRQRLAWAGGEFRLFVPNIWFILHHTFLWTYGALVVILLFPIRWATIIHPSSALLLTFVLYFVIVYILHWKDRNRYLIVMPIYSLFQSLIITPLGVIKYFLMVYKDKNFGMILPRRKSKNIKFLLT